MSEQNEGIKAAMAEVIDLKEELSAIEEMIREAFPHEMARIAELRKEIPLKLEELKESARQYGGNVSYLGYDIKVQKKSTMVVAAADLLERAQERGEISALIELGFIEYSVNAKQVERLPGQMKSIYGAYIEKKDGTAAVTLPAELKV
jgi:hypothetical protein